MFSDCVFVLCLLIVLPFIGSADRLNEYIRHYETLDYDTEPVHRAHSRAKRSLISDDYVHVQFKAHGHDFRIRLKRDLQVFNDRLEVHGPQGEPLDVDTSHIYHGHILGEVDSVAFGSVIDGVFEGKIMLPKKGAYYVEKARHYFPDSDRYNRTFHSVIYHEDDVEDPYAHLREGHSAGCGINDDVIQWMNKIQYSETEDSPTAPTTPYQKPTKHKKYNKSNRYKKDKSEEKSPNFEDVLNKYSKEANERSNTRHRRATRRDDTKNTCSLYIQTDPLIWRHIREGFPEHLDPKKQSEVNEKTKEEILSLIAHHVTAVNYIYRDTKFDGKNEHRNIKFEVQRIKIDDDASCRCYHRGCGEMNQFCLENIDVSNFLNIHSLGNHEDFCLAYVFTYRDFTGGTLGLAWVASASGASGGICEKYKTYTETIGGMYQSTKRSLNTGIITFVNYNSRVPPKVSQLTLAHEIGHNFGSPHDYPPECRPGGPSGNYIMFASATSGDRPNNSKFSSCSIGNISNVLDAIEDKKKRNCFTASAGAFCGNKIVEAGEECDCGYDDKECNDQCCYPRILSIRDKESNRSAVGCTRRNGTECSPSQGPCCSSECKFISAYHNEECKMESDCSRSSKCNGTSAECPAPTPRPDKTRCNNGTQLCIKGECTGSICLEWNLEACSLTTQDHPNIDKRKLCELACQNGTDICRSTSEFSEKVGLPPGGISLRPGSPCDNFQGYCDVFLKCRAVDADGPLVRLMNLLLNKETLINVAQWITEYWWAVLLMGIGFIIFMGLFIKCCAVHTPSSNPKLKKAQRITDTLRRPMNTLRRMRYNHGGPHNSGGANPPSNRSRRDPSSRPSASQGPRPGYGEGRGHYHAPKAYSPLATAPPAQNYGRQNHPELYAGAYEMRNKV
ncbi:disintegrin and metalloproteinase domain-containing protein 10 isoform X1 [Diorhabda sublineata]|uniref:disintegrin and metalloproteinase domain-containing protein 10 isoform X1 n=1 Tax=Diorhabda sublineata TaxID=1163346 RepID=UPI0024E106AB|nr:disintegrin and metalloproteinase domain-containing protein 10 isoform X1 [Diorhabda sublineata]